MSTNTSFSTHKRKRKRTLRTVSVLFTLILLLCRPVSTLTPVPADPSNVLMEQLRSRLETAGYPPRIQCGNELIYASTTLPALYERRSFQPLWIEKRDLVPAAAELVTSLREAGDQALRPQDYHLGRIERLLHAIEEDTEQAEPRMIERLVDLDLLLTDAFLVYGSHLLFGRVNPETIDPEWHAKRRGGDLAELLETALKSGRIKTSLEGLLPPQEGYARMRLALQRLRALADRGGWRTLPEGPGLRQGDVGGPVTLLRERLRLSGDLVRDDDGIEYFDDGLERAVKIFQERHGLDVDGVVGPKTRAALNVSVEQRIQQIELNMERWRWLPQELGKKHIRVNIAGFELEVVENDRTVLDMRVIVGKQYRRTPVFSDMMTYLVLCPYWVVPPSIATQDILPLVKNDIGYLSRQRIRVYRGWGTDAREIDPGSIDWTAVDPDNLLYRFRQDPGPNNALGRVKFMFPNKFNVYLHDTPSPDLFNKTTRTFSSGCLRIEKPIELAEYLLRDDPVLNRERIIAEIEKWSEKTVRLPHSIPVHILYWTAWIDDRGKLNFRDDVYGRDLLLEQALQEKPPSAADSGGEVMFK